MNWIWLEYNITWLSMIFLTDRVERVDIDGFYNDNEVNCKL